MTLAEAPIERSEATDSAHPRRTYIGVVTADGNRIIRVLDESATGSFSRVLRVRPNGHSPTGFSWGYGGSGPAETAFAILADYLEVEPIPALYQRFKADVVTRWPMDGGWTLPGHAIETWLAGSGIPQDDWASRAIE